ncbi:hypothetical protein B484DRAFT_450192 [Ochromonadaceae sp. CCMP2298]|nr:hypothetical protein B484DRAFT_450192 [Ochromonadaceae sp. CCMP2298]
METSCLCLVRRDRGVGLRVGLVFGFHGSLVHLGGVRGLLSGVAAANGEDKLLGNAAAGDELAAAHRQHAGAPAGIDLHLADHAAPAHTIVIVIAALHGAQAALVVHENARDHL